MEIVNVFGKYKVYIGEGILEKISEVIDLEEFSKVVVVTDEKIPSEFLNQFEKIIIPLGEQYKNIESVKKIWKRMLELGCDRKTLVINLGGGVMGDMGGFAASCYMRGVRFIQVPTTLLSAVDASVGGKVGINFEGVKNLIGSFNQPVAVLIDVETFKTLPEREFNSGFGEIIKHGIIADKEYFKMVTSKKPRVFSKQELIEIIKRSCEIKARIIAEDEKELGNRKLLNFGHTIGHALESISLETDYPLLHGEAVAIGMVAEAKISLEMGLINENEVDKIISSLENAGLPVKYKVKDLEKIIRLTSKDKKAESGKVNWTLIKGIVGGAIINQRVNNNIVEAAIKYISE